MNLFTNLFLTLNFSYVGHSSQVETPVMFNSFLEELDLSHARRWRVPKYSDQRALGYSVGEFSIPAGMEERVSFWLDIYTKYTTDEGVLHDSQYVHLVYNTINFSDIMKNKNLTLFQKQKKRLERVKQAKKKIKERLQRLSKHTSSAGLSDEDLRYWTMFSKIDEKQKFIKAKHRSRLRFQLGQKDRFFKGIYYSGQYIEQIEEIFKSYNLPLELTRIPFVESSFNVNARSSAGASGIWQFMRSTAKPYLKINNSVDERNDPIKSTYASAKLFKKYYQTLKSWPLAVTGYNHGAYGVRKLVKKYKTKNLVELIDIRQGRFGFASANFYASFLAALEAEKNAEKYYQKKIYWADPIESVELTLTKTITLNVLEKIFDGKQDEAKKYNIHLNSSVWKKQVNIAKGNFIRVPKKIKNSALAIVEKAKNVKLFKMKTYRVRPGDTLSEIAETFGISVRKILYQNKNLNPQRIRVGQKLYIPH